MGIDVIESAWEPACGEGHMAAVIGEFVRETVTASDILTTATAPRAWTLAPASAPLFSPLPFGDKRDTLSDIDAEGSS